MRPTSYVCNSANEIERMSGPRARSQRPCASRVIAGGSSGSCEITTTPSAVMAASISSVSTPISSARRKAASVFSGSRPRVPRWPCRSKACAGTASANASAAAASRAMVAAEPRRPARRAAPATFIASVETAACARDAEASRAEQHHGQRPEQVHRLQLELVAAGALVEHEELAGVRHQHRHDHVHQDEERADARPQSEHDEQRAEDLAHVDEVAERRRQAELLDAAHHEADAAVDLRHAVE